MDAIRSTGFHSSVTEPLPAEYQAPHDDTNEDDSGGGVSSMLTIVVPVCLAVMLVVIITVLSTFLLRRRSRKKQYLRVSYANQQSKAFNNHMAAAAPDKFSTLPSPEALASRNCATSTLEDLCQSLASFDKDTAAGKVPEESPEESPSGVSDRLGSGLSSSMIADRERNERDLKGMNDGGANGGSTSTEDRKRVSRSLPALNAHSAALNFALATPPAARHVTTGRSQTSSRPRSFTEKINYFVSGGGLKYDLTSAANNYQQNTKTPELRCRPRSFNDRLNLAVNRSSDVEIISFRPRSVTDKTINSVRNSSSSGTKCSVKGSNVTRSKHDNRKVSANSLRGSDARSGPLASFRSAFNSRWSQFRRSFSSSRNSPQNDFVYIDHRKKTVENSVNGTEIRNDIESNRNNVVYSGANSPTAGNSSVNDISLNMSVYSDAKVHNGTFVQSSCTNSQSSLHNTLKNNVTMEIGSGHYDEGGSIGVRQEDCSNSTGGKVEHCRTLSDFHFPSSVSLMDSLRSQINGAFQTNQSTAHSQETLNDNIPCLDAPSRGTSCNELSVTSGGLASVSTSKYDIKYVGSDYSSRPNHRVDDLDLSKTKNESSTLKLANPSDNYSFNQLATLESNYIVPNGKYVNTKKKQNSSNKLCDIPRDNTQNINDSVAPNRKMSQSCFELEKVAPRSDKDTNKNNETQNVIYHSIGCF